MAGAGTKRIVDLTETSEVQSGDYIAIDSTARGTKKTPVSVFAKAEDLTAEQTARQQADEAEAQAREEAINTEKTAREQAIEAEQTAREEADDALTESVTALSGKVDEQGELIQNPTKTVSGEVAHFTDGADMPAESVIVNIEPQQSGTGTPSPENVRPISGWTEVKVIVSPTQEATDGTTTTTPLGRTVYGGTLDVVSGVLTVTHGYMKYTNIGTTSGTTVTGGWRCNFLCPDGDINKGKWTVQSAPTLSMFDISKPLNEGGISKGYAANNYTVIVPNATSKETADAILEGLELVYPLKTPQTYQLTPTEVKTLLGENNVWADAGAVEVTYRRDINLALEQLEALLNS